MKKVVILILLLALIGGVSFLKSLRDADQRKVYAQQEKSEVLEALYQLEDDLDSMKALVAQKEISFADSMVHEKLSQSLILDSALNEIDIKEFQIDSLKKIISKSLEAATKEKQTVKKKKTSRKILKEQKIIDYYKTRYKRLPNDLSDYEKKVAAVEIKEETAEKFSISLYELKKLRSKYNIRY